MVAKYDKDNPWNSKHLSMDICDSQIVKQPPCFMKSTKKGHIFTDDLDEEIEKGLVHVQP